MGSEETRNESMIIAVQERVKRLCSKDNVLFQVLTESDQSLLDLYTAQVAVEKVIYIGSNFNIIMRFFFFFFFHLSNKRLKDLKVTNI